MIRQTTRLPEPLHTWLIERAKANHRSLNAELISILTEQKTRAELSANRSPIKTFIPGVGGIKHRVILEDGSQLESTDSVNWTPTTSLNSVFIGGDFAAIEKRTMDMVSGTRGNER